MAADPPGHDPTLTPTEAAGSDTLADTGTRRENAIAAGARAVSYQLGDLLGKGGMGEVWAATDDRLGREVALKRMRTTAPTQDELQRFLREAKIQARLPHPSVVPVYELDTDEAGFPYFTMKKLAGTTLAELLATGKATQQRLLRALVDVCLAVQLAHETRIVHRDLKPSNIVLGDYGEVYVLDWGVARLLDEPEPTTGGGTPESSSGATKTGQLLGTPGYMAPEQVRGLSIGPPADVYALGSILFEILAGQPLHPRGTAALASTLDKHDGSPAARMPARAIPPELDLLCTEVLVEEAAKRPTARELADRIQHYLDGDRDTEQRRVLAARLVLDGRAALDRGDRAEAVRIGGRALALDPENEDAASLVMALLTKLPDEMPPEVERIVAEHERKATRERSRRALLPMLVFYLLTPFLPLLDVIGWLPLAGVYAAITAMTGLAFVNWRVRPVPVGVWLAASLVACVMFTRLSGPFVLTPVLICAVMMSAAGQPWMLERPVLFAVIAVLAVVTPFGLEELGVFARSWRAAEEGVISNGTVFARNEAGVWSLFISNVAIVVACAHYARAILRDRNLAQRALLFQSWYLGQLLPRGATAKPA